MQPLQCHGFQSVLAERVGGGSGGRAEDGFKTFPVKHAGQFDQGGAFARTGQAAESGETVGTGEEVG